jgi:hypothetical protein
VGKILKLCQIPHVGTITVDTALESTNCCSAFSSCVLVETYRYFFQVLDFSSSQLYPSNTTMSCQNLPDLSHQAALFAFLHPAALLAFRARIYAFPIMGLISQAIFLNMRLLVSSIKNSITFMLQI